MIHQYTRSGLYDMRCITREYGTLYTELQCYIGNIAAAMELGSHVHCHNTSTQAHHPTDERTAVLRTHTLRRSPVPRAHCALAPRHACCASLPRPDPCPLPSLRAAHSARHACACNCCN